MKKMKKIGLACGLLAFISSANAQSHDSHSEYSLSPDWVSAPTVTPSYTDWDTVRNEVKYNACKDKDQVPVSWDTKQVGGKKKTVTVGGSVSAKAKTGALSSLIASAEVGGGADAHWTWESDPINFESHYGPVNLDHCSAIRYKFKIRQKKAVVEAGTMQSEDRWTCSGSVVNSVYTAHSPIASGSTNVHTDGSGSASGALETADGIEAADFDSLKVECKNCNHG
jgi:hypothetical protein